MSRIALVIIVALAFASVGCGGGGSSKPNHEESQGAQQILADVAHALANVKSFHISGSEDDKDGHLTITGDVALPGKMHFVLNQGAQRIEVTVVGGDAYLKGNLPFWQKSAPKVGTLLANKWVKVPAASTPGFASLTVLADPALIGACFVEAHLGTLARGGRTTVAGKPVIVVIDKGDRPGSEPGRLYVATRGEPLPVRVEQTGPQAPGGKPNARCHETADDVRNTATKSRIDFSAYDEKVDISPPSGALDFSRLAKPA